MVTTKGRKRSKATETEGGEEGRTPRSHVCLQSDRSSGAAAVNIRFAKISGFVCVVGDFLCETRRCCRQKADTNSRRERKEIAGKLRVLCRMTHLRMALHRITRFGFRNLFGSDFDYERALLQTWMYPPLSRYASKTLPRFILAYHRRQFAVHSLPPSFLNLFHNVALLRTYIPVGIPIAFLPFLPSSSCRNAKSKIHPPKLGN